MTRGRWVPAAALVAAVVTVAVITGVVVAVSWWAESCWGPAHTCSRQHDAPQERR